MYTRLVSIAIFAGFVGALGSGMLSSQVGPVIEKASAEAPAADSPGAVAQAAPARSRGGLLDTMAAVVSGSQPGSQRPSADLHLRVPPHGPVLRAVRAPSPVPREVPKGKPRAHAYQYMSRIFERPRKDPRTLAYARRGVVFEAGARAYGPGCDGHWYRLQGAPGYVCTRDGFAVSRTPMAPLTRQILPDVDAGNPYRYGKAISHDVLRYYELPSAAEERAAQAALAADQRLPDTVERRMQGVFLLALDRIERSDDGRAFYRTVRGRYVRADQIEDKPLPAMRGELLGADNSLPIAFVYGEGEDGETDAPLLRRTRSGTRIVGVAEKHARFPLDTLASWGEREMAVAKDGFAAPRSRVRVASRIPRPDRIPRGAKWIHVNLDEQTLVAYEDQTPVFATLVSSGKGAQHATPKGVFQIRQKHISTTMNGPDPDEGFYEVEEVPWTQYYYESYALHGAYWHDDFGKTRSHGCTNIAPVDARFLYHWTDGKLPRGVHGVRRVDDGSYVYFTRDLPPQ